jgi:hypothetical protein
VAHQPGSRISCVGPRCLLPRNTANCGIYRRLTAGLRIAGSLRRMSNCWQCSMKRRGALSEPTNIARVLTMYTTSRLPMSQSRSSPRLRRPRSGRREPPPSRAPPILYIIQLDSIRRTSSAVRPSCILSTTASTASCPWRHETKGVVH